jgi:hypothetical protein
VTLTSTSLLTKTTWFAIYSLFLFFKSDAVMMDVTSLGEKHACRPFPSFYYEN